LKKDKPLPPSSEAGAPYPKELFFGIEINKGRGIDYSFIAPSGNAKKRLVASKRKSYVDQRYFCTGGGIVEVAKEVEDPVDLEMLMLSPVPARGEEGKKKNRCLLWMSVPAKMDSSNERMRTVILQSRLQRRRRLRAAQSRLGVTEARREPLYHRLLTGCCILAGDTDCGGLDMEMPVAGLMMGMAFRARVAAGWCIFMVDC
jgi:hypothetical protein